MFLCRTKCVVIVVTDLTIVYIFILCTFVIVVSTLFPFILILTVSWVYNYPLPIFITPSDSTHLLRKLLEVSLVILLWFFLLWYLLFDLIFLWTNWVSFLPFFSLFPPCLTFVYHSIIRIWVGCCYSHGCNLYLSYLWS